MLWTLPENIGICALFKGTHQRTGYDVKLSE
uniref:Uncharacterized protein n=1 Tax=Rhizophora mucronata TaxID=61149 RepID=A0A2P2PH25_RHIMU